MRYYFIKFNSVRLSKRCFVLFLEDILLFALFEFSGKEFQSLIPSNVRKFLSKLVDIACREKSRFDGCLVFQL